MLLRDAMVTRSWQAQRSALTAVSIVFLISANLGGEERTECFSRIVQPAGWAIPAHSKPIRSGTFRRPGLPDGITFTEFAVPIRERFFLPWHHIEGDSLVLMSPRFRADTITRLEVGGIPFAWFMFALGADTGVAADVWILDRDGDGRFIELQWNPDVRRLPGWVAKRLAPAEPNREPGERRNVTR